ncbi:MAG: hypothetical protein LBH80_01465 [Prevotellaceae bacterium]|jgi:hypothetical protein|nr:hypothetical protein [Prevotellaceae bacterium]
MPYRRLPNTDQARYRALKTAIGKALNQDFNNQIVSFSTLHNAESYLNIFEKQMRQYQQTLERQVNANKHYQQIVHNARMYISHFIKVFNLTVIRGEIKKKYKRLYQLDPDSNTVPDLGTEAALLKWGKAIIDGEGERVRNGGMPIYNPVIAKVKIHFDTFKEYKMSQKLHQQATNRNLEELAALRKQGDELILDIWNQIETKFKDEPPYTRVEKCKKYGVVYYYRKGEKELTPEDDLVKTI